MPCIGYPFHELGLLYTTWHREKRKPHLRSRQTSGKSVCGALFSPANPLPGIIGLHTGLQSATEWCRWSLPACCSAWRPTPVCHFRPAQLLQVQQALAQQQAAQAATQQADIQKRTEAEATKLALEQWNLHKEKNISRNRKVPRTRTPRNKVRMILPHADRQVDTHRVQWNARRLLTPMLRKQRWKRSATSSERPSIFSRSNWTKNLA